MDAVYSSLRLVYIAPLIAHLLMTTQVAAQPLSLQLPIMVVYNESGGSANWRASINEDVASGIPALNAGDRLRLVGIEPAKAPTLGEWRQGFKRFSHETCRRKFLFGKTCDRYYAHDKLTARLPPQPFPPDANLKLILVNALTGKRWDAGERQLRELAGGKWVDAKGPLEMNIIGGISYPLPKDADFKPPADATPEGPRTETILGKSGPERWITITVEVEAGRRN